ncbi:MAG: hypothetical protein VB013_09140 [Anaerolineaceae bacterium]|nr:hypothetical protein [Anaerolineaceae bacterium]
MTEWISSPQFEENVRQSFAVPEIRPEFVDQVYGDLMQRAVAKSRKHHPFFGLRPAWTVALAILTLAIIGMLAIGPQRVYAEFLKLFGYIPGVGIVDQSNPIRVLAEPVSVTRDGITVTVTSATLTGDRTQIAYRIFGVPGSAYPDREDVAGCWSREYLLLADGTQLAQINYGYEPVPTSVNEVVFVIPCIANTLPGKVPENWELPLRFVPAPPDLTVMPVIELSPSSQITLNPSATTNGTSIPTADNSVTVSKVIETSDGYILIGSFQPQSKPGESFQQTGAMEIHDASGKKVAYTYPQDVNEAINQEPGGTGWAAQFKAAGLVYPLTISFSGAILLPSNPDATTQFTFDAGSNPQPGQEWDLNREIQLAGHTLMLTSITANSQGSYSFNFQVDPKVYSVGVQIEGYTPNGGGGGGGGGLTNGKFETTLAYAQLPTGVLDVDISNLVLIGDSVTWQEQWSPATVRTDLPVNPTHQPSVCLSADSLAQVQSAPVGLFSGSTLMYEPLDNSEKWGLVLYNLDGSGKQVLAADASGGIFSPDGSQMAYPAADGIHVMDLSTKAEKVLPGTGFNMHWSPDGRQIAYVGMSDGIVDSVFIINLDGTPARQISDLSYESAIGWSPDGKLYFVAPYTGGAAWKVYSYDLASSTTRDLFTIENGTPKFLNPMLSPDGNWIAYRGRDNSSLYLVHPDGSDMHLVLDSVGAVGIAWTSSGWLGVSIGTEDPYVQKVLLINLGTCDSYILNGLHGQLEGLVIQ